MGGVKLLGEDKGSGKKFRAPQTSLLRVYRKRRNQARPTKRECLRGKKGGLNAKKIGSQERAKSLTS